ncbi:hypothetical protein AAF712_009001 [Marasmius tenuissimus]|uniref:Uncharacterized protein n=1 Tax=Marasmius tenuissimus TaxID=585030 RepID=A0ABR2ZQS3_9AGAR
MLYATDSLMQALNFTGRKHFTEEGIVEIPLYNNDPVWEDENDNDSDFGPMPPPPGEEDALNSHDTEGMYDTVLTGLLGHKKQYRDTQTRCDHTEKQTQAWERQHERLVNAYLEFKLHGYPYQEKKYRTWEME